MVRLTYEQTALMRELLPEESHPAYGPSRRPFSIRKVLEAVRWIPNTGAQWQMLSQSYPDYKTVNRHFQQWCQDEVLRNALADLAIQFRENSPTTSRRALTMPTLLRPRAAARRLPNSVRN